MDINILSSAQAMGNCIESGNHEWYDKHEQRIIDTLLSILPHGSGIDCKWKFDITNKAIECKNSYHVMNDNGMYSGYIDFTVKIKTTHRDITGKLDFTITGRFGKNQDIKDYLCDTISYSLENH